MKDIINSELLDETAELTIEVGDAICAIEEILEFGPDTLVVLEQFVGDPVHVYANGRLIAKGDIIVVDDHLGIEIIEIM